MQLKALLVNGDLERGELIRQSLLACGHEVVSGAADGELSTAVAAHDPDIVVIEDETPGDELLSRLRELSFHRPLPLILFTSERGRDFVRRAVRAGVTAYVADGLEAGRVEVIVEIAIARFGEIEGLRRDLAEARANLLERKTVERAKGILMKQRGYDEPQAYHALRKMAMDRNLRIGEVAENVIAVAELLN